MYEDVSAVTSNIFPSPRRHTLIVGFARGMEDESGI